MAKPLCGCGCGSSLEGLDSRRRYLNDTHRKRVSRGLAPGRPAADGASPVEPVSTEIADRLKREFESLGVLDTYEAQTALGIAVQLDGMVVQGAAFVSLSKELDRRVEVLRLKAELPDNPITALEASMAEKQTHLRLA